MFPNYGKTPGKLPTECSRAWIEGFVQFRVQGCVLGFVLKLHCTPFRV